MRPRTETARALMVAAAGIMLVVTSVELSLRAQQPPAPAAAPGGGGPGGPGPTSVNFDDHAGFTQIFDGTAASMANWEGATEVWKLVGGAIVAENTPEKPVGGTTFIWFKDTEIGDFELKMELKVEGGGNSGIQYRSRNAEPSANFGAGRAGGAAPGRAGGAPGGGPAAGAAPPPQVVPAVQVPVPQATAPTANPDPCAPGARGGGAPRAGGPGGPGGAPGQARAGGPGGPGPLGGPFAKRNLQGYQFDTDANGCSTEQLFEGGRFVGERGITTRQGQVILMRPGQPNALLGTIPVEEVRSTFKRGDYNQYHVIVRGDTFTHIVNGKLASVTIDDDVAKRVAKGVIGIQIEGARVVAFRNVWSQKS